MYACVCVSHDASRVLGKESRINADVLRRTACASVGRVCKCVSRALSLDLPLFLAVFLAFSLSPSMFV